MTRCITEAPESVRRAVTSGAVTRGSPLAWRVQFGLDHTTCSPLGRAMKLILSCISKGEQQTRLILDQLVQAGISKHAIIVLHPGDQHQGGQALAHAGTQAEAPAPAQTTMGAAASGSAVGSVFGWVLGYGVLSIPGALLGGAVGAVAGAAINASRQAVAAHQQLPDEVHHHYASRIVDDHAAVLVQLDDMRLYETVLIAFLAADGRHILTSRNNRQLAEADQLEVLVHHPTMIDTPKESAAST